MKTKVKLYFRNEDSTNCETLDDILNDAKDDGLKEITVLQAIPDNGFSGNIWCMHLGEVYDKSECNKKECCYYSSKSGRGVCESRGKLYLHGEKETFKID